MEDSTRSETALPNGLGAAAILGAGAGSFALGAFALLGDAFAPVRRLFIVWTPTGALSGVTLAAIAVWLVSWYGLAKRWRGRDVALVRINALAFALLGAGLLLSFPPFMDIVQGK
jgi:hypothetical protein